MLGQRYSTVQSASMAWAGLELWWTFCVSGGMQLVPACNVIPQSLLLARLLCILGLAGVEDSKTLDEAEREAAYEMLTTTPGVQWAV